MMMMIVRVKERYDDISRCVPKAVAQSVSSVLESMLYALDDQSQLFTPPQPVSKSKKKGKNKNKNKNKGKSKNSSSNAKESAEEENKTVTPSRVAQPETMWQLAGETFEDGDDLSALAVEAKTVVPAGVQSGLCFTYVIIIIIMCNALPLLISSCPLLGVPHDIILVTNL